MKSYKILFFGGVCAMATFSACQSDADFLTEQAKSTLTIENAFNTSDQVLATVLSAYDEFSELYFSGTWGQGINVTRGAGTDMWDGNDQCTHYSDFVSYWSTDATFVKNVWDKYYKMGAYCNLALSQVDNVTWQDETTKTTVVSEAHFLRGLAYLRLAEHYGGVPIVSEYSENPRYDYERATRAETYNFAIEDLKTAYEGLPEKVTTENYGRAGKGAAALYLAEAYLALGVENSDSKCYENAKTYANAVIKLHPIMEQRFGVRNVGATGSRNGIDNEFVEGNVMSDLFVADNVIDPSNTEAVWIMPSAPDYATYSLTEKASGWISSYAGRREGTIDFTPAVQDINWALEYVEAGAGDGPWKAVSMKYGGKTSPAIHGGYGWGLMPNTWYAAYDMWNQENNGSKGDLRYVEGVTVRTRYLCLDENHSLYEKYCGWEHIDKSNMNSASKFYPIFYKNTPLDYWDYDASDPGFWNADAYVYRSKYACRSSEAYLLLAEACLRLGDEPGAMSALNVVRKRAQAEEFTHVDIQTILDERGRELIYEEDRWATFLREKPEEWKSRIKKYSMYCTDSDAKVYPEVRRWAYCTGDIKFNLWPIPQTYIDLNSGAELTQNDGWK